MATPVQMPKVGISVESCILTKWHKQKGDAVKTGDLLFTYETDKSTMDEEARVDGTLIDVFYAEGDDIPCMLNVAVIGNPGESTEEFRPKDESADAAPAAAPAAEPVPAAPAAEPAPAPAAEPAPAAPAAPVKAAEGFVKISPRARALADKLHVDYRFATPTGAEGRIVEEDIRTLAANGPAATAAAAAYADLSASGTGIGGRVSVADLGTAPAASAAAPAAAADALAYEDVAMPNIRKVIAKAMIASLQNLAQLTHNTSFDATDILNYRKLLKANGEKLGLPNITLNDIVLYAVSRTLLQYKELNAHLNGDTMRFFRDVHLGMAVDTDRGLMVPTIMNANRKSLAEISVEAKALASDCQKGGINPDKLQGASFTVSNLGSFGIESFTPIINAPQTGILGVDTVVQRPKEVDGQIVLYPSMGLSLTYDHRALDGGLASRFLRDLKYNLENFTLLMAK